jgi:hypothetical protein
MTEHPGYAKNDIAEKKEANWTEPAANNHHIGAATQNVMLPGVC